MAAILNSTTAPITYVKDVRRNRESRDWDAYVVIDGQEQYIGSRARSWDAEQLCDAYVYEQLQHQPLVTVERHWSDKDESPNAPPEGASVWTDYECGNVVIGIGESDYVNDMHISGVKLEGEIVTLAALTQIHADLGHLLADARVRAALLPGSELSYTMPPTRMVRVKDFKANCSFPLAVGLNVGCAIERARHRIGLTREQMFDVVIAANQVIEDMFDLTVGMGILGNNPTKLADAAYQRGFRDAIDAIRDFLELRETDPEKAAAVLVSKHAA